MPDCKSLISLIVVLGVPDEFILGQYSKYLKFSWRIGWHQVAAGKQEAVIMLCSGMWWGI